MNKTMISMVVSFLLTSRERKNNIDRVVKTISFSQSAQDLGTVIGSPNYFNQFKSVGEI